MTTNESTNAISNIIQQIIQYSRFLINSPKLKYIIGLTLLFACFTLKCYFHKIPEPILIKIIAIAVILLPVTRFINRNAGEKYRLYIAPFILISISISMLLLHCDFGIWLFIGSFCFAICCISDIIDNDVNEQLEQLDDIRNEIEKLHDPDTMLTRLGVDILKIEVGIGLLAIADPDQEGQLLTKTCALRHKMTDNYGYVIPSIRILDSPELDTYEYEIYVRDIAVAKGTVYPAKQRIYAAEWEEKINDIPNDVIVDIEPVTQKQIYWINKELTEKHQNSIQTVSPEDVIIQHLEYCAIKYVDKILTDVDIVKYLKLVEPTSPSLIKYLTEYLSIIDIRRIFVNLIKDNVSVKDIHLIFLKLCEYVQITNNIDLLTEKLKNLLTKSN